MNPNLDTRESDDTLTIYNPVGDDRDNERYLTSDVYVALDACA